MNRDALGALSLSSPGGEGQGERRAFPIGFMERRPFPLRFMGGGLFSLRFMVREGVRGSSTAEVPHARRPELSADCQSAVSPIANRLVQPLNGKALRQNSIRRVA